MSRSVSEFHYKVLIVFCNGRYSYGHHFYSDDLHQMKSFSRCTSEAMNGAQSKNQDIKLPNRPRRRLCWLLYWSRTTLISPVIAPSATLIVTGASYPSTNMSPALDDLLTLMSTGGFGRPQLVHFFTAFSFCSHLGKLTTFRTAAIKPKGLVHPYYNLTTTNAEMQ